MYFEEEVRWLLPQGFWIVMAMYAVCLVLFYLYSKNKQLIWFAGQWGSLVVAFFCFCQWILKRSSGEDVLLWFDVRQCIFIVLTGLFWAVSMAFFLRGIYGILKRKNEGR